MTQEEAQKVVEILKTCDHGCEPCVSSIFEEFENAFPEWHLDYDRDDPYSENGLQTAKVVSK